MRIEDETAKLRTIRERLRMICRGHSISVSRYDEDNAQYCFYVDDGKRGMIAITKEWLDRIPAAEIDTEIRRKSVTLKVIEQTGEDHCLVLSSGPVISRPRQN
jgi:hypothetical protein